MSDTHAPTATQDDARVAAALDNWKRKLLDLSKRNRALNFRMTRASTVAIVDEQPAEVFRRLYLLEKRMRFAAAPPPAPPSTGNAGANTSAAQQSASTTPPVTAPAADAIAADTSSTLPPPPPAAQGDLLAQADLLADGSTPSAAPTSPADAIREDGSRDLPAANPFPPGADSAPLPAESPDPDASVVSASADPAASPTAPLTPGGADGADAADVAEASGSADRVDVAAGGFDDLGEDDEALAAAAEFAPYAADKLAAKHRDDTLQTTSPPDKLDVSLRRIEEQARETQEEQGVNTLFLALGMLHYWESKDSEQVFRAPLVLLPVALARTSAGAGYTLSVTDDDYILNPALQEYLRRDFGIALPLLPDPAEIPDDYDLQAFLAAVTEAVKGQAGWQVTTEI